MRPVVLTVTFLIKIMVLAAAAQYVSGMALLLRYSLAMVLAALVALTGLALASERGMSRVAGQIVLCTGHGPLAVWVDANGQPVDKIALCPDQTASLLGALHLPEPETDFAPAARLIHVAAAGVPLASRVRIEPRGRSPPVLF